MIDEGYRKLEKLFNSGMLVEAVFNRFIQQQYKIKQLTTVSTT